VQVKSRNTTKALSRKTIPAAGEQEQSLRLGTQLKHLRLAKRMRLRDVADQSGYSESLISKFENNKATPSLNTLHRIAKVLGSSVATLLNEDSGRRDIVMSSGRRPIIRSTGAIEAFSDGTEAEVMIPLGASTMLEAFLVRILPGGSSSGQRSHEGEEVGYVLKGELTLTVAEQTYHLITGDSFFFPSTSVHQFHNAGSEDAEIIWVNTPPTL